MDRYITFNSHGSDIRISNYRPKNKIAVPCNRTKMMKEIELVKMVIPILYAKKRKEVARNPRQRYNTDDVNGCTSTGKEVKFSLRAPDPWLIVLTCVMWEGIIQGLTWDVIKFNVRAILLKLQEWRLAPRQDNFVTKMNKQKITKTQLGFSWTSYIKGRKQYELFLGLKREYRKKQCYGE